MPGRYDIKPGTQEKVLDYSVNYVSVRLDQDIHRPAYTKSMGPNGPMTYGPGYTPTSLYKKWVQMDPRRMDRIDEFTPLFTFFFIDVNKPNFDRRCVMR